MSSPLGFHATAPVSLPALKAFATEEGIAVKLKVKDGDEEIIVQMVKIDGMKGLSQVLLHS